MTTTSDGSSEDPTIAMITDHCDTKTTSDDGSNDTNSVKNNNLPIKFEFKNKNIINNIEHIHKHIIETIENQFPTTICESNNPTHESIRAQKMDQETFQSHFKYLHFKRSSFELQCIAHHISTSASFNEIKETIKPILTKYNGFIRINKWDTDELDIVNIGWLHKAHPKVHNRDFIHDCIQYACTISNVDYVPIEIFTKNVSAPHEHNRIYSNVIQFACKKTDRSAATTMLKTCFSDSNNFLPGTFIPNDLAHKTSMDIYKTYINKQNEYIEKHRAITLFNISITDLYNDIDDKTDNTLFDELKKCPFIDWISPAPSNDTNGKIMFSTSEENYPNAIDWIDDHFIPLHTKISDPDDSLFDLPARRRQTDRDNDSYTQSLATNVSDITTSTCTKPLYNAWTKPLSIVAKHHKTTATTEQSTDTQQTTISNLEAQIQSLKDVVMTLQTEIKTIKEHHSKTIENAINQSLIIHSTKMEEKYDLLISSINDHWKTITSNRNTSNITSLPPPPPMHSSISNNLLTANVPTSPNSKISRTEPSSGSSRLRKVPRRLSEHMKSIVSHPITNLLIDKEMPDTSEKDHVE